MAYKILLTEEAEKDFEHFLDYLIYEKRNPQTAEHLIEDFDETEKVLSDIAGSLKLCENPRLRRYGYRKMHFLSMRYFMLYRIDGNNVIIDNMFHDLQDYENLMK